MTGARQRHLSACGTLRPGTIARLPRSPSPTMEFTTLGHSDLRVGDVVRLDIGYTPFAVNYFDAYHVIDGGPVVDIWPVMPRGPQHQGLLAEVVAA